MKLVVISPEGSVPGEVETVKVLLACGLSFYHVRKPTASVSDVQNFLSCFSDSELACMMLHSQYELHDEFKLKGAHIPERERTLELVEKLQTKNISRSTSFHKACEIEKWISHFDYAFFSPVFESISKPGYGPNEEILPAERLREHASKLVALGGLSADNASLVRSMGWLGAGFLGAIWNSPNPKEAYLRIEGVYR